jgi:hypothetical protein
MEAQQHKNRYQDEGGETKEEAYFNRAHGVDFTRATRKKPGAKPGF